MSLHSNISLPEQHVINFVRELRQKRNIGQEELAQGIGVAKSFIGNVESPKSRAKYNLNHIDRLARFFGISPKDFLPVKPLLPLSPVSKAKKPGVAAPKPATRKRTTKNP